jgi:N-acetylglutamate synthase-like GNAT family acetyltransferase
MACMKISEKPYLNILEQSFPGIKQNIIRCDALGYPWEASKLFIKEDKGNDVISHVALLECPVLIEGIWHKLGALHGICTRNDYRGQGLATELIHEALTWSQGCFEALFLFTEIPDFYERLSFNRVQEYRFYLPKQHPQGSQSLRPLIAPQDDELFVRCFGEREPLSHRLWIKDHGLIASFNALFATYPNYWSLYCSPAIDGFMSFEIKDKTLHLFDIIASRMPTLAAVLDHLPQEIDDIYFYFSPDRFTEDAIPEPYLYDNGHLLIYGPWQPAKPFMISPLSRC